ncbi:acyl-CoA thioester hydrolase [Thermophagus xiamenensis]|uniref:Acyl-CoA thioester hydrolase n=2 Tax=Thermophagus xiamenensis TaxID=385682 RepID=A0A1I1ZJA9_9BACT|nr:acyl-CoA thioester hydrolase [Thermophagus xiamenensis]
MRFSDVDGFGHINNGVYNDYYDLGRMYYMRDVLGWLPGDPARDDQLVVVHTETDFFRQIFLGQSIYVLTSVVDLGNRSLKMHQWLIEEGTDQPLSVCKSVMSCFRRSTGTSFPLPDEWRKAINNFETPR